MGVATGCGCKEVYRFLHTTYSVLFLQQHPKCFVLLYIYYIVASRLAPAEGRRSLRDLHHLPNTHNYIENI